MTARGTNRSWTRWAAALAASLLPLAAAAQNEEASVALSDQRFELARIAPGQSSGSVSLLVDVAELIEIDILSDVEGLVTSIETPRGSVLVEDDVEQSGGQFVAFSGGASDSALLSPAHSRGFHYLYQIPAAGSGRYLIHFDAPGLTSEGFVVAQISTSSPLVSALFAPNPTVVLGDPVVLTAALFDGDQSVGGASIEVQVRDPQGAYSTLVLVDDGAEPDTAQGDGLYSGEVTPAMVGDYNAVAEIRGHRGGLDYARQVATKFSIVPRIASLQGGFTDLGLDDDSDGLFDRVRVVLGVDAIAAGQYRSLLTLRSSNGRTIVRSGDADLAAGAGTIAVDFDAAGLRALQAGGPYEVARAQFYAITSEEAVVADQRTALGFTRAYSLAQLQRPGLALTGRLEEQPFDDNGNGRFDRLTVALEVDVKNAGFYTWSFKLADSDLQEIDFGSASASLSAGLNLISLTFDGNKIGDHGVNGPYLIRDLLMFGAGQSLVLTEVGSTTAHLARQFEGFRDFTPPTLTVSVTPTVLWSPNHRMVEIAATIEVEDDFDPAPTVQLVGIVSNEEDNALGDGNTTEDISGAELSTDDRSFALRAERSGTGNGRTYTVTYAATDAAGNTSLASAVVSVPKSNGQ